MSDRTFTITFTERERLSALFAFGHLGTAVRHSPVAKIMEELHLKLVNAKGSDVAPDPKSGTDAARAILSPPTQAPAAAPSPDPIALRDRWACDRKGVARAPKEYETVEADICKLENAPLDNGTPRTKVTWAVTGARGFGNGNCFDESLFPFLALRLKQRTTFYIVKSGKYVNVVGVRA